MVQLRTLSATRTLAQSSLSDGRSFCQHPISHSKWVIRVHQVHGTFSQNDGSSSQLKNNTSNNIANILLERLLVQKIAFF